MTDSFDFSSLSRDVSTGGLHYNIRSLRTYKGVCPVPTCTKTMDNYGDHVLAFASSSERISRHNRLRDSIFTVASQAGLGPRKEEPDLLSGNEIRLGNVFLPCFFLRDGEQLWILP